MRTTLVPTTSPHRRPVRPSVSGPLPPSHFARLWRLVVPARRVTATSPSAPPARQASWPLGHCLSSVPQARALTRELLHMWGLHDQWTPWNCW
ncbi:hypothetical protein ACFW1M_28580 [Streptomyces inhibens]|uniref:hypothetical protein n=1 Tax=Streptomyces inhibens TaxID=2293571 RepID=UPI0036C866D1